MSRPDAPRHAGVVRASDTALITGASSGIGEEFARQLARRGVDLILVARSEDRLRSLAGELTRDRPDLHITVLPADLSEPTAATELTERVRAAGLTVDLLVNNAGFGAHVAFAEQEPANVAGQIQLNCGTLAMLTALLLPDMIAQGRGGIINLSSTAGFQPVPTMAVYAATKAFVLSFTEALWVETRETGVRVLALCPGGTETGFFDTAGAQFLTRGRQTPRQVVDVALHAFDSRRGPTVISGTMNRLSSLGHRILPRAVMAIAAAKTVAAD